MSLMSLAPETLEEIASHVESHRDLISLAMVSSAWKARIIPRHSQYRVIRIWEDMPHLWEHLSTRADLARTIRAVHIFGNRLSRQIYPTTLIEITPDLGPRHKREECKVKNMCQALQNMTSLKEFAWSLPYTAFPTVNPAHECAIFWALSHCKSLSHIALWGRFAERAPGPDIDPSGVFYPVSDQHQLIVQYVEGCCI